LNRENDMSEDRPDESGVDRLEPSGRPPGRSRRRTATVGIAAAAVLGVAGAGAWGVAQFLDGGTAAAAAVPQNALAYVSVDLDPDGGQKLEVARTLRKFPAIKEEVGSGDDLRRWIFDAVSEEIPCELDFGDDLDPWLGNKAAFAVLPGAKGAEPVPMAAIEVKDEEAAEAGVAKIASCGSDADAEQPGLAFVEGFMVIAESDKMADDLVGQVADGSLADDDGFNRWVDEAGGSGILTAYASAEAPMALLDAMEGGMASASASSASGASSAASAPAVPGESDDQQVLVAEELPALNPMDPFSDPDDVAKAFEEFEGGALALRFDDGALELEMAGGGMPSDVSGEGGSGLSDLPTTTALALGMTFSDTAAADLADALTEALGEKEAERAIATAEAMTGLSLPEDLQTLLGDGLSVAVDGSIDLESAFGMGGGDLRIPAGARIVGDPDEIVPLLEKLVASAGAEGQVVIESGDGVVAFGLDAEHVAALAGDGGLGEEPQFEAALPDLEEAAGGLFVNFDAGDWLTRLAENDAEARENLEPLGTLGITSWQDGDVVHGMVRLSTD
jgi:hypothetical protein